MSASVQNDNVHFIGRAAEIAMFRSVLTDKAEPVKALYIHGPGGTGKTTLLKECIRVCDECGVDHALWDSRDFEPSINAFLEFLGRRLDLAEDEDVLAALQTVSQRFVLFLDTFEMLQPLDNWIRDEFIGRVPDSMMVVLSGRATPSTSWRAAPGWRRNIKPLALRNLNSDDGHSYLSLRDVPDDQHESVLKFTHGHPLALALVADAFAQHPGLDFQPEQTPDVIQALLEQFVEETPGPSHRAALEACALVRATTESLLKTLLAADDVRELFDWLRSLTFVEAGPTGLFPHDLAREALIADLRWRNPDRYVELHGRARSYYLQRLKQTGTGRQLALFDFLFLHRANPVIHSNFDWQTAGMLRQDVMQESDLNVVLDMLRRHEGEESVKIAQHWYRRQAQNFFVYRDASGAPQGFLTAFELNSDDSSEKEIDPAARACLAYLEKSASLRPGEQATLFRFWMDRTEYQRVSPAQGAIFASFLRHYLTTARLAFTFLPCDDPAYWLEGFSHADKMRLEALDFDLNGHRYGMYGHDWRKRPPSVWLDLMARLELSGDARTAPSLQPPPLVVLSREDFQAAVRTALRTLGSFTELQTNPLLKSRVVADQIDSDVSFAEKAACLQSLLTEMVDQLKEAVSDEEVHKTIYCTYINPIGTQEEVADALNLAFSTYRRRLRKGIEAVTELLWQREIT